MRVFSNEGKEMTSKLKRRQSCIFMYFEGCGIGGYSKKVRFKIMSHIDIGVVS